jgi:hypothetical protein
MKKSFKTFAVTMTALSTISIGSAFASPDASGHLSDWYRKNLQKTTAESVRSLKEYANSLLPYLEKEQKELTDETNGNISKYANETFLNRFLGISRHLVYYADQLSDKTDQLTGQGKYASNGSQINKDFDTFVSGKNTEVNNYIDQQAELFVDEVTTELDGIVQSSSAGISTQKLISSSQLEEEINSTKTELNHLLAAREEAATETLKQNLDKQIAERKAQIIQQTQELKDLHSGQISARGSAIEEDALSSMEQVISSIH